MADYSALMGMLSNNYSDPQKKFLSDWYQSLAGTSDSFDNAKAIRDKQQEITDLQNELYNHYQSPDELAAIAADPKKSGDRQDKEMKLQKLQAELQALQSKSTGAGSNTAADSQQNFKDFMNPFGPG